MDVSDLYDSFHAIAASIWRDFGASVDDESWDDIIDSLEHDLFLAACAHRAAGGMVVEAEDDEGDVGGLDPDEMPARIRLMMDGKDIPGASGQYHSHAFYPDPETGDVPNAVMTGNLLARLRPEITLVIVDQKDTSRSRRPQLPQIS
jgi:hypothetical protein